MAKKSKPKREKNIILVLVEGQSEKMALEGPLSALFDEIDPRYRVIFALQRRSVNQFEEEQDDPFEQDDEMDWDEEEEVLYSWGGDITSSSYVTPSNIETKITNRFFKPLVDKEKIYPKMVLEVIHIVDLDGAYLSDERVVPFQSERTSKDSTYYNSCDAVIECANPAGIIDRNARKRSNIDYLRSLQTIKIESKSIPYSVYYFGSNLDHFLHNEANMNTSKVNAARRFSAKYVFDTEGFCNCFLNDADAAGTLTYDESWAKVINGDGSIHRVTNIDLLIKRIKDREFPGIE